MGIASASETTARLPARVALCYLRVALYWLAVAVASVALAAILATMGARLFGYSPYVMYGGSMGSSAPAGSVAFVENVPAEALEVGDVVLFRPPSSGEPRQPLMRRIISIEEVNGQPAIRTEGDANGGPDPWQLRLSGEGSRLAYAVPYLGYLLWFFQRPVVWAVVVLPLVAYLGFLALRRIWAPAASRDAATRQAL